MDTEFTPKQRAFVEQYLIDLNGAQAAIRAGYSKRTANTIAAILMAKPHIRAAIDAAAAKRAEELGIQAKEVLRLLWNIATADANEVVQHRRGCCRYCHGTDFLYQRTPSEMRDARRRHEFAVAEAKKAGKPVPEFDEAGGIGYDPNNDPHPDCPECHGDGEAHVYVEDTRALSGAARTLYAGIKQTKDGLEIKLHDRTRAAELVGKHLRLFAEKLELSGPDNGPVQLDDGQAAARLAKLLGMAQARKEAGEDFV